MGKYRPTHRTHTFTIRVYVYVRTYTYANESVHESKSPSDKKEKKNIYINRRSCNGRDILLLYGRTICIKCGRGLQTRTFLSPPPRMNLIGFSSSSPHAYPPYLRAPTERRYFFFLIFFFYRRVVIYLFVPVHTTRERVQQ